MTRSHYFSGGSVESETQVRTAHQMCNTVTSHSQCAGKYYISVRSMRIAFAVSQILVNASFMYVCIMYVMCVLCTIMYVMYVLCMYDVCMCVSMMYVCIHTYIHTHTHTHTLKSGKK